MKNSGFLKLFGMRGWILPACALFMLASFAPMALADSYDDAIDAYNSGDYATALKLLQPLADQDDADAQTSLGEMYDSGEGVAQNFGEALKWYRLAATQGDDDAQ